MSPWDPCHLGPVRPPPPTPVWLVPMPNPGYEVREVPLDRIRFAYSRVRPVFSGCGRKLEDTVAALVEGRLSSEALPTITCIEGGHATAASRRSFGKWNDLADASDEDGAGRRRGRGRSGEGKRAGKGPKQRGSNLAASDEGGSSDGTSSASLWYFSLNNRRLYCLKAAADAGGPKTVKVRVRAAKDHEKERYTVDRCVLRARIAGLSTKLKAGSEREHEDDQESLPSETLE